MPIVIWLVFGLAVTLLVRRTALGMLIEAIGVNRRASHAFRRADRRCC